MRDLPGPQVPVGVVGFGARGIGLSVVRGGIWNRNAKALDNVTEATSTDGETMRAVFRAGTRCSAA